MWMGHGCVGVRWIMDGWMDGKISVAGKSLARVHTTECNCLVLLQLSAGA